MITEAMSYLDDNWQRLPEEVYLEMGRKLADAQDAVRRGAFTQQCGRRPPSGGVRGVPLDGRPLGGRQAPVASPWAAGRGRARPDCQIVNWRTGIWGNGEATSDATSNHLAPSEAARSWASAGLRRPPRAARLERGARSCRGIRVRH